ncbi:aldehyde dehydrogenase family protein [Pseudorhodobacter sp.]|uniref:aldehyde dehydrogenase family protein n=1 Tax=Pseudorhodobacter sp. TaxID=1934400 RepID=UPI0026486EF2|nr:aldehyde dehydrogenase family protein [Pseudorhodobacter sp.]MDN5787932.1 aldehyde dehydrogenase family protein [Pseudorhodobacter sp.]
MGFENTLSFYINGEWVTPLGVARLDVENPATEEILCEIALGSVADADRAVAAARAAFAGFSVTPVAERIALLERLLAEYNARAEDFAQAMRLEMGAPIAWARAAQVWAGQVHLQSTITAAKRFEWETARGASRIIREGIGVCALITPWNWPMNQIVCKMAPAIAAGCTMVLKPSEIAPLSGLLWAEICDAAGVPAGVFNLVNGTGPEVGVRLSSHPDVDMVSFTGSTRAGVQVAANAAPTVKRVAQELGGKSANIILPSADIVAAVTQGVAACMANTGQSCDAPTRMFIPRGTEAVAFAAAKVAADASVIGDTADETVTMGPLVSRMQYDKVQGLIGQGIAQGATLICGGLGRPDGMNRGHYVRPTVFGNVTPGMVIEREEIFGPVLSILSYDTVDQAVVMANDTDYGLAAYVQGDLFAAQAVARRLKAGQVNINGPEWDTFAPFGGYKQSGNGREYADWGIHDFCEVKALVGYGE